MVLSESIALLLVALGAVILPSVSRLLRLPGPVTEILFGIILGKSVLQLHVGENWLPFLAHLGFLLLMFHAGMEIDFKMLRDQSRKRLFFHLLLFLVTFCLSLIFCHYAGYGFFMALVLSTTSLGLVMPILKEVGLTREPLGQSILIAATLADFLTLLGITLFLLWNQYGLNWRLIYPLPLFFGFALVLRVLRLWVWWNPDKAERLLGPSDDKEMGVRFSMALLFLFVALSELVHLEPVLGAFLGGCVLSFVFREKGFLENKLSALGFGFLIPIFFIHVGMNFDLSNILHKDALLMALKLMGLALAVKLIPGLMFGFIGESFRSSLRVGILLSTRLSLIVAAASIGVSEGLISEELKDSIVLLAIMTCLLGPTIFKAMTVPGKFSG